jgi:hypothetical protein
MSESQNQSENMPPPDPQNKLMAALGVVVVSALFLAFFVALLVYDYKFRKALQAKAAPQPPDMLQSLRNDEAEKLTQYELNPATGEARIPIDRAMDLEARRPWRPNAPRPTPTPTPTPASLAKPALPALPAAMPHAATTQTSIFMR